MLLPNFLCVGAAKSGTTSLYEILRQHPKIYLPGKKEIQFFYDETKFSEGIDWYQQFFKDVKDEKAIGEFSAAYMFYKNVPQRINNLLGGDVKLIFILRNPVDRAYSEYLFNLRRGLFSGTFEEAINYGLTLNDDSPNDKQKYRLIHRSQYAKHIKRFLKYFNKKNIHFIIFEKDFIQQKEQTIQEIFQFLEVAPYTAVKLNIQSNPAYIPRFQTLQKIIYRPNFIRSLFRVLIPSHHLRRKIKNELLPKINKGQHPKKLSSSFRKDLLNEYFKSDIKKLEKLLERDLSNWYKIDKH